MHSLSDPELDSTLEMFVEVLVDFFGKQLISVILHGSVVFDDLAPGYGDLDFVAVIDSDLPEQDQQRLVELRRPFRAEGAGIFARMVEGAFLPRHMLDPVKSGKAFWWGTSGERPWSSNELGWIVMRVIREHGRVIHGKDIRGEVPEPSHRQILEELRRFPPSAKEHAGDGGLHSPSRIDRTVSGRPSQPWPCSSWSGYPSKATCSGHDTCAEPLRIAMTPAGRWWTKAVATSLSVPLPAASESH